MNDNQEDQIKALLSEFGDVITEKLGHVKGVVHKINRGSNTIVQ